MEVFDLASLSILVVDDEPVARKFLVKALQKCGYKKITAVSKSTEALELIRTENFNIALVDVLMPEMDGLQLLEEITKLPNTSEMSVIMVSATEDLGTVFQCLNQGADDYMVKPILLPRLKNLWSNLWKKRKEREIVKQLQEERSNSAKLGKKLQNLQSRLDELTSKIDETVETPLTAITKTISNLQSTENLTPEVNSALSQVLKSLASSNLYKPGFQKMLENKDIDTDTRKWLMTELSGITQPEMGLSEDIPGEDLIKLDSLRSSSGKEQIVELTHFDFDVWSKSNEELFQFIIYMFEDFSLFSTFGVDKTKFARFVSTLRSRYNAKNPYHNFTHAFDVTQTAYSYLTSGGGAAHLHPLEIFGLLVACICHDVGHFGLNNQYLITTRHPLAIRYNDQSVLENFHCATAFEILSEKDCNIFENLDAKQYASIRKFIVTCILATDPAKFMELLNKFKAISDSFQNEQPDDRLLFMQLLIKCADISNPAKPYPIARYWAEIVQEEFFRQGDIERSDGLEISGFMDRENPNLAGLQTGFADFIVIPLFQLLENFLPQTKPCMEVLLVNRNTWEDIKQKGDTNTSEKK